ncbi:hypothetical protein AVEN_215307-1 [Araneus ventricosus]|uniref:Uncharacterized protein n=1 Tax=Araneus ventricosus TaxID=182803 RepID=A0A4Y2Q0U4_ARAVE|nr:hypothetical protein AVEN_215307-1 [Araneus ventricosus]
MTHGSIAWCLNSTGLMKTKLSSIPRRSLISMSGAYHTTPAAALQRIFGLPPLRLQVQYEAKKTTFYRLQLPIPPNISNIQPPDLERKATGWSIILLYVAIHSSFARGGESTNLNVFTDGSKHDN